MSSSERVSLYTVPSTWINYQAGTLSTTYRRVVGLQHHTQQPETAWAVAEPERSETSYTKSYAEEELIDLSRLHTKRLVGFFNRYFVEQPESTQAGQEREPYNCHRFGYWMRGSVVASKAELPDAPDHIVAEGYEVKNPLPSGGHGVIGSRTDYALAGAALHSVVGLGEESPDCLQVVAGGGFMGVDSYENILAWYNQDPSVEAKLYTL